MVNLFLSVERWGLARFECTHHRMIQAVFIAEVSPVAAAGLAEGASVTEYAGVTEGEPVTEFAGVSKGA